MAIKLIPRPRDPIQLGKLIGDIATAQVADIAKPRMPTSPAHRSNPREKKSSGVA